VRRRERFVQVQVHHVDAEIAGARHAPQRVHVGAVHVHQRALFVQDGGGARDVLLETPRVFGLVTINAATSSVTARDSTSRSITPVRST
jgi:hypothetical protein